MTKALTRPVVLNLAQKKIRKFLVKELGVEEAEADRLASSNDGSWETLLTEMKRQEDLKNLKSIEKMRKAMELKAENGSMEQAQKAALALAVLSDKVFMQSKDKISTLNFTSGNQPMQVNLGFQFEPYKRKGVKKIK